MPGRPIEIADDAGQGGVRSMLFHDGRPLLDRRPDERMAEAQQRAVDLDEPRVDCRRHGRCWYAGGSHDLRDPVAIVERGDQHEPLRVVRKIIRARRKRTLEARVERNDVAEPRAGSSVLANRRRELGEGQWVPGGLPEDSVPHRRGEFRRESRHHVPRVAIAQRLQSQLVDVGGIERRFVALAKPHHHHERIGAEAAGNEGENADVTIVWSGDNPYRGWENEFWNRSIRHAYDLGPDALDILKAGGYDILGPDPEAGTLA